MFEIIKVIKTAREVKKNEKVFKSEKYYKDLNEIPLYNWWKCEEGDYRYLWKERHEWIPFFFKRIFNDMTYQMDYLNLVGLRKKIDSEKFKNKYLITGDIKYKRKAGEKALQYELLTKSEKNQKLNDVIKIVQLTLKLQFHIDPHKMSAGYFFNLMNDAIKIIEYGNN